MNTDKKFQVFLIVACVCAAVFSFNPASSEELATTKTSHIVKSRCDQKDCIGAAFYNFEAILIDISVFPPPDVDDEKDPNYAEDLKFVSLRNRAVDAIKENFSECLTNSSGSKKSIIAFGDGVDEKPVEYVDGNFKEIGQYDWENIHDPQNLSILVTIKYHPRMKSPGHEAAALMSYFIYRPDVTFKDSRIPGRWTSDMIAVFPERDPVKLKEKLNNFFSSIRPSEDITKKQIHDMGYK